MKRLILTPVAVAAVFLCYSLIPAEAGTSAAEGIQTITAKITPKKRAKKKAKNSKLYVEILTGPNSSDPVQPEQPPSATRTKVNFPKNVRLNTKAVPRCKASKAQLQNTTSEQAVKLCGEKSVVSVGGGKMPDGPEHTNGTSAWVTVDLPGPGTTLGVPVRVVALNGTKKNQIYLHARADAVNVTSILVGKLKKGPKGYGKQLDVRIPPLAAGAITRFTVTVKNKGYVKASCESKREKWQAKSVYTNHAPTADTYQTKCDRSRR